MDGADVGITERVFRSESVAKMRSLGLPRLTYRLRTELGVQVWHWNPQGSWSDAAQNQGYWVSNGTGGPVAMSWGYRLPRRGSTTDQANDDGYSRLDDGDPDSFWKSNPYLDRHFTGEPNTAHPQWVVVDLGQARSVNAVHLHWGVPYATRFRVEYCVMEGRSIDGELPDTFDKDARWLPFPKGIVTEGKGGKVRLGLANRPIFARFIRLWLTESSGGNPKSDSDIRDNLGYALREIEVGLEGAKGTWRDWVRHAKTKEQTVIYTSSTDPWHRATDRDPNTEQPGLDTVAGSGLGNGFPILMSCGLLYDTPENAANLVRYLRQRKIAVSEVELGEEPDGQYLTPEDYGALYCQWVRALHKVDPTLRVGGPSFQTAVEGWVHWPDTHGDISWMRRFLNYLRKRGQEKDFAFFSFEWYPFDDLRPEPEAELRRHGGMLDASLARLEAEGVPRTIPWYITEYGWSAFATRNGVDVPGALLNAEITVRFLLRGGSRAYLYGYTPNTLIYEPVVPGATWGNLTPFLSDNNGAILEILPTAYAMQLLSTQWVEADARSQPHALYECRASDPGVGAYLLKRPDSRWSLLLINRDRAKSHMVRLPFASPCQVWQYGRAQYVWKDNKEKGRPVRNQPPVNRVERTSTILLPPYSMTVAVSGR